MGKLEHVFAQPVLEKLPEPAQTGLLNDRLLNISTVTIDGNQFGGASFAGRLFGMSNKLSAEIEAGHVRITAGKKQSLDLTPSKATVFLQKVNAATIMPTLPEDTTYNTIVYLQDADPRVYLKAFGSRTAYYLATHDVGFKVNDLLGLANLKLTGDERSCAAAVTDYGYGKLVAGTDAAFLDNPLATNLNGKLS